MFTYLSKSISALIHNKIGICSQYRSIFEQPSKALCSLFTFTTAASDELSTHHTHDIFALLQAVRGLLQPRLGK